VFTCTENPYTAAKGWNGVLFLYDPELAGFEQHHWAFNTTQYVRWVNEHASCLKEQLYMKSGSPIFQQKLNNLQSFLKKKKLGITPETYETYEKDISHHGHITNSVKRIISFAKHHWISFYFLYGWWYDSCFNAPQVNKSPALISMIRDVQIYISSWKAISLPEQLVSLLVIKKPSKNCINIVLLKNTFHIMAILLPRVSINKSHQSGFP